MCSEIVKVEQAASTEMQAVMAMVERVALNPDADISKLEKMLDMQERILNRNAQQAFTADLAAMQSELPLVGKAGRGHNNAKYAKLEDINEAIRPTLQKYGFAVTFRINQTDKSVTVTARLSHRMGYSEETNLSLPLDTSGSKNAVQAVGSTVSYAKRYAICALLNISTGDDDDGGPPKFNEHPSVTNAQIKQLRDAANVAGKNEAYICQAAHIERIEDLLQARFGGAMNHLKSIAVQP
jgi:hypothetical protein